MRVEIRGTNMPGRRCGPGMAGEWYEEVHVGLARGRENVELVPGDAPSATWSFDVDVRPGKDGETDFFGPFVLGGRGERHLGLRWGTLGADGSFQIFRAAKLRMEDVDPALVERARDAGTLVADLGMTDRDGFPICASVRPPAVVWSATPG